MKKPQGLSKPLGALVGVALLTMAGNASASLIGDEVTFVYVPNSAQGTTGIVGVDTFTAVIRFGNSITADIGASSIRLGFQFESPGSEHGIGNSNTNILRFTSLDWIDNPTGILVGATLVGTNVAGLRQADFAVGDHQLDILIADTAWRSNSFVEIELITDHAVVDLSAPMSLALFAIGLGGLGAMMRRRAV